MGLLRLLDSRQQWLDNVSQRLARPSVLASQRRLALESHHKRLGFASLQVVKRRNETLNRLMLDFPSAAARALQHCQVRLERDALRLGSTDPQRVLQRGYAWVTDARGQVVTSSSALVVGQPLNMRLSEGQATVEVIAGR